LTTIGGEEIALGRDVILKIDNNQTVGKVDDILVYLQREKQVGDNLILTVLRDGKIQNVNVTLDVRPMQ
jgi:S1-C subfamily serine protease